MPGKTHDRKLLILLYKLLFQEQYPLSTFTILIDPGYYPIANLPYLPDIYISQHDKVVKWIEVGSLPYDKGLSVVTAIGEKRFLHIPASHPIFKLDDAFSIQELMTLTLTINNDVDIMCKNIERNEILKTLIVSKWNKRIAAERLNLTYDQLRYRILKHGIKKGRII